MKKIRLPLSGYEWDCFGSWRKYMCYLLRPGVPKKIKKAYNKRMRQYLKKEEKE